MNVPFVDLSAQHQPLQDQINQAIQDILSRGDFILGKAVSEFEENFAHYCGVKYAVGVASGTSAITLALQACGIGQGDEVLVPSNTFIASVIGIFYTGATPIFVDCDLNTALINFDSAREKITSKTKAILPVHLYGQMVNPSLLLEFAKTHNLLIIEDCAQAHLANNNHVIAGSLGIASAFSFYPSKNLGAMGNGGMVITNDENVEKRLRKLRNYGAESKYFHTELGTNSRLDSIQASILNIKLPYLQNWNLQRNHSAKLYDRLFADIPRITPIENQVEEGHIYHLYVVKLEESLWQKRETIQQKLASAGIMTGIHYPIPCHLQPAYRFLGYQEGDFPCAETLCRSILSLPMYVGLQPDQIEYVVETLKTIIEA